MPQPELQHPLQRGERVYLRHPTRGDEREFIERNLKSRALHRGWVKPPTDQKAFALWVRRMDDPATEGFFVCRREDGAIVGVFVLNQIVRRLFQSAYMGYYAERPYNGQGYMRDGMQLVLRQAFTALKLHRLEANIQPENVPSIALARGAGFRLEGFSPRYLKISGRWRDHERWAMLVDDWKASQRRGGR